MNTYSRAFKAKMVQRMLLPHARTITVLSREAGVPVSTLHRWRNDATLRGMASRTEDPSADRAPAHEWTAEEKLALVLEASQIADAELGEFLRRKGIHEAQLNEWRAAAVASLQPQSPPSRRDRKIANAEAKRIRELERELKRKDKALAEAAALLVLKKKVQEIWGDEDDDTDPKNDA